MSAAPDTLYEYYEQQSVLPTFANFKSVDEFRKYSLARMRFFRDKLFLPREIFRDVDILEFGPDSGENAISFASLGAKMMLVEPNAGAHAKIRAYFDKFDLAGQLNGIADADVLSFQSDRKFDLIDAEGFIYTVDTDAWLKQFARLLSEDGIFVVSYYERFGAFFELCLKALHHNVMKRFGLGAVETAEKLYSEKWDSIPHTRKFESWVMDVLLNPFVRLQHFIGAADLCERAAKSNFALYSSWPSYKDHLSVYWHKKEFAAEQHLESTITHLRRSGFSFITGSKMYIAGDERILQESARALEDLVKHVDDAIAEDEVSLSRCLESFDRVLRLTDTLQFVAEKEDLATARASLASFQRAFQLLQELDLTALQQFTNSDQAFLQTWGMPAHFAVFRKMSTL